MSLEKYKQLLEDELKNNETMNSSVRIKLAKRKIYEENSKEDIKFINEIENLDIADTINILDNYLNNKRLDNKGIGNIILLSIALILIVIVLFAIILV